MDQPLIMMSSITYAMRGKELLKGYGIKAEIERTPKNSSRQGCGYSLYVPVRTEEAERLLRENGIRISGRSERGMKHDLSG